MKSEKQGMMMSVPLGTLSIGSMLAVMNGDMENLKLLIALLVISFLVGAALLAIGLVCILDKEANWRRRSWIIKGVLLIFFVLLGIALFFLSTV